MPLKYVCWTNKLHPFIWEKSLPYAWKDEIKCNKVNKCKGNIFIRAQHKVS